MQLFSNNTPSFIAIKPSMNLEVFPNILACFNLDFLIFRIFFYHNNTGKGLPGNVQDLNSWGCELSL